jgi:porin
VLGNFGGSPTDYVGENQIISNLDADDTWKIFEAWYQQRFFKDMFSIKIGLYDVNSEFDAVETCDVFMNDAFGTHPALSQTGQNGPSIFPNSSVGVRLRYDSSKGFYIQAAVLDGVPGNPDNPKGTHIIFGENDGLLMIGEVGLLREKNHKYHKYAFGFWGYSESFEAITGKGETGKSRGVYFLTDHRLTVEKDDSNQGLNAFLRLGTASHKVNQLDFYLGAGFSYTGLIPGRDEDLTGIAVSYAQNGKAFRDVGGQGVEKSETFIEWVYHMQVLPWLVLKPGIQYFINPGTDPTVKNAFITLIRSEISF